MSDDVDPAGGPAAPTGDGAEATAEASTGASVDEPTGRLDRWRRSPRIAGWALALTLVALLAATLALVVVERHDDSPRARAGDVVDVVYSEDPLPHQADVVLPWARLRVAAGDVREELPELLNGGPNLRAPDGGRFVRVEVQIPEDGLVPLAAVDAPFVQRTEVVLRADGEEYPVTGDGGLLLGPNESFDQGGSVWVAVEGDPQELELLVSTDDVTQVVDAADGTVDAGAAADLVDLPGQKDLEAQAEAERPCGPTRSDGPEFLEVRTYERVPCRLDLSLRTPFVDGLGWAEEGREYLVVQLVLPTSPPDIEQPGAPDAFWYVDDSVVDARLDGVAAIDTTDVNSLQQSALAISDIDAPVQVVFDVPADEPTPDLDVALRLRASAGTPFDLERASIALSWTVAGEELA